MQKKREKSKDNRTYTASLVGVGDCRMCLVFDMDCGLEFVRNNNIAKYGDY